MSELVNDVVDAAAAYCAAELADDPTLANYGSALRPLIEALQAVGQLRSYPLDWKSWEELTKA